MIGVGVLAYDAHSILPGKGGRGDAQRDEDDADAGRRAGDDDRGWPRTGERERPHRGSSTMIRHPLGSA